MWTIRSLYVYSYVYSLYVYTFIMHTLTNPILIESLLKYNQLFSRPKMCILRKVTSQCQLIPIIKFDHISSSSPSTHIFICNFLWGNSLIFITLPQ